MFGGIGDFIIGTSAIRLIKNTYPDAKITVMAPPGAAEIVRNHPFIDEVIAFQYESNSFPVTKHIELLKYIRRKQFDLSISLDCKDRFALLTFLASIPTRIGADKINHLKPKITIASILNTHQIHIPYHLDTVHQTAVYQYFVKSFFGIDANICKPLVIHPTLCDEEKALSLLALLPPAKYKIAYCIKGKDHKSKPPGKDWPQASFLDLINQIHLHYDAVQFIIGAKTDEAYITQLCAQTETPIYQFGGKTTLPELASLLKSVDLLITVDTGIMHLAAMLDVPTVAIYRRSSPVKWAPCNPKATIIYEQGLVKDTITTECISISSKTISVPDVFAAVAHRLMPDRA